MFKVLDIFSFKKKGLIILFMIFVNIIYSQEKYILEKQNFLPHFLGSEMTPFVVVDNLYFSTNKKKEFAVLKNSQDSLNKLFQIFKINLITKQTKRLENINENFLGICNIGPIWINDTQNFGVVSANKGKFLDFVRETKIKQPLQLFQINLSENSNEKSSLLSFCNINHNYTHPYLNKTMDSIFFSSDMDGGFGGYDLYYSVKKEGKWQSPINLGERINSEKNELFPSFQNGKIYFSSDRMGGKGGLDIYVYEENQLKHLTNNLNSEWDDFSIVFLNEREGFFTSNREASFDAIFKFSESFPEFRDCTPYKKDPLCFTFYEESGDLEDSSSVEYEWSFGDGKKAYGLEVKHCFEDYGIFQVDLNVVEKSTKYVFYNEVSYEFENLRKKRLHIETKDSLFLNEEVEIDASFTELDSSEILNYYWKIMPNEELFQGDSIVKMKFNSTGLKEIFLGIVSKDTQGQNKFSCVSKKINVVLEESLKKIIFDESNELKKIKDFDTIIKEFQNETGNKELQNINDSVYINQQIIKTVDTLSIQKVENENKVFVADTIQIIDEKKIKAVYEIFYDINLYESNSSAIIKMMNEIKNKKLESLNFSITSFTDPSGSSSSNEVLSRKRSEFVLKQLIDYGISINNIVMKNKGENLPPKLRKMIAFKQRKSIIVVYEK